MADSAVPQSALKERTDNYVEREGLQQVLRVTFPASII
jgi:hypothetical protein